MKLEKVCEVPDVEKHTGAIEALIKVENQLITGADDGVIKIWSTSDLKCVHQFKAHDYAITHLLSLGDRLYTSSMDQTINLWQFSSWRLIATLSGHEDTPRRLATNGEFIFSGDDKGEVIKWTKDGRYITKYEMLEEIWDMYVQGTNIYTVRDRGMTISEIKDNSNVACVVRSVEGRAPFYIKDKNLTLLSQSGKDILQFKNDPPSYDLIRELKGHEYIITTLSGWKDFLVSAGYDENVSVWNLTNGKKEASLKINGCPTAIQASDDGEIFIAGPENSFTKLKAVP